MVHTIWIIRASSTWKHDTRKFGPQHALDSQSDEAWKSAPSEETDPLAYYEIHFGRPVSIHELRIQFQGGFAGMDCIVHRRNKEHDEWEEFDELYVDPIDSNEVQTFPTEVDDDENETIEPCTALKIDFGRSTDFYGRIVIYSLEVWGKETGK